MSTSLRHVVSVGDARVVVQEGVHSGPGSFAQIDDACTTFVDKSLVIEAFLRDRGGHHVILRPGRCGKSYTLSMIREFLQQPLQRGASTGDITTSRFAELAISDHGDFVSKHFQQYPVLYIDLKDIHGTTYEEMLISYEKKVLETIRNLSYPYSDLVDNDFCMELLRGPGALQERKLNALKILSRELRRVYGKRVMVLIDNYDSPVQSAIEHGYASHAEDFFTGVFNCLLKSNPAVYASMMVGICRVLVVNWGWVASPLNNLRIFPMHAEDERYSKFFLFTEKEVEILCESHSRLSIELLRPQYNGYTATCKSGPVRLYNPFSVVRALEANNPEISNFWIESGWYSQLPQIIRRAGAEFRNDLDLLLAQNSVNLLMDKHFDFSSWDTISDSSLWGLLYYAGFLTTDNFGERHAIFGYICRIPNGEVASQWHRWVKRYNLLPNHACHDQCEAWQEEDCGPEFCAVSLHA